MKRISILTLTMVTLLSPFVATATDEAPRLVLQITVDGLRGDLPERFKANMGEGGFRYLLEQGIHYSNAHYQHANTETIVGHASLATGAPPSVHGMVGNVWYDRSLGRVVYNIEDENYTLLTSGAGVDQSTEIDTTQKAAKGDGRSPLNFKTSTFSDELIKAYNGKSRAYSVSFKDRGAVSLGGELGKAFWYSKASGGFVTSNYYYDKNPAWLDAWNAKEMTSAYSETQWQLLLPPEKYLFADEGNVEYKTDLAGFGRTFPHSYGPDDSKYYTTLLSLSPAGDELVADFATDLIEVEQLGQGEFTDYLSVSFSANDYVIHMFGPSSLEAEDNLLQLDRILAELLKYVDQQVGLKNTLIVLSSDHGAPDIPGYIHQHGGHKSGYFSMETLKEAGIFDRTQAAFDLGEDIVRQYADPYLYLNHELIDEKGHSRAEVQALIASELTKIDGIDFAITASDIEHGSLPDSRVHQLVSNNHSSNRSGDIYLVYDPDVYLNDFDGLKVASVHGSPWRYDTYVPVIFAGYKLKPQQIARPVTPYDIAPTLSQVLGITFPSGATGDVLTEVIHR